MEIIKLTKEDFTRGAQLDKIPNTIEELGNLIVRNLNVKSFRDYNKTNVLNALKRFKEFYEITIEHIRFLLLNEEFRDYRRTIDFLYTNYGKSKVTKPMKRFRSLLRECQIQTSLITQYYKRYDNRNFDNYRYLTKRMLHLILI